MRSTFSSRQGSAPAKRDLLEPVPDVLAREVPVEGILEAQVLARIVVVVGALAPQELAAGEYIVGRMPQQIDRRILALVEGGRVLEIGIVDPIEAVADR